MKNKEKIREWLESCSFGQVMAAIILLMVIFVGLICLDIAIAMYIWNIVVVAIFGVPTVTFWQMFGLIWLFKIFTGFNFNLNSLEDDEEEEE
jgi:uncharacterized membrane protein